MMFTETESNEIQHATDVTVSFLKNLIQGSALHKKDMGNLKSVFSLQRQIFQKGLPGE
jgi:hypothetical protein